MGRAPHALTIAGSDPSGGAGIQADLKTFFAFGAYGMAALTSLTAQNTRGVTGIHDVPPGFVAQQLEAVFSDIEVHAAKTGMLKSAAVIEAVAGSLAGRLTGRLVVDPVMVATSGDRLIDEEAVEALVTLLFPRAAVVTPNRAEAEVLSGASIDTVAAARDAARRLLDTGAGAVLLKGVREGEDIIDVLAVLGEAVSDRRRSHLPVGETHGTGCTLSAAIAAGLAHGRPLSRAVADAQDFVRSAIRRAVPVGHGSLPLAHLPPDRE